VIVLSNRRRKRIGNAELIKRRLKARKWEIERVYSVIAAVERI